MHPDVNYTIPYGPYLNLRYSPVESLHLRPKWKSSTVFDVIEVWNIFPWNVCIWLDSVRSILGGAIVGIFLTGYRKVHIIFRGFNELFQLFIFSSGSKIELWKLIKRFLVPSLDEDFLIPLFRIHFQVSLLFAGSFWEVPKVHQLVHRLIYFQSMKCSIWLQSVLKILQISINWSKCPFSAVMYNCLKWCHLLKAPGIHGPWRPNLKSLRFDIKQDNWTVRSAEPWSKLVVFAHQL